MTLVQGAAGSPRLLLPLHQFDDPRHLIRVDVQDSGLRIPCGAAPLAAAVEAREKDRALEAGRSELRPIAIAAEAAQNVGVRLRGAPGDDVLGELLTRERRRRQRQHLFRSRPLAIDVGGRHVDLLIRKQTLARHAVEDPDVSALGDLGHGVDDAPVAPDADEGRRRGQVAVPKVMPHELEVPQPLPGGGIECDQAVGEQIVPVPVGPVKVVGRGSGGREDDAPLLVQGEAAPCVRTADVLPRVLRPGFVAQFAGMRDRVEDPAQPPGADVIGANVAGRGGQRFAHQAADDQQVPVDDTRCRQCHREIGRIAAQVFPQVDPAVVSERSHGTPGTRVQAPEPRAGSKVKTAVAARLPVVETAVAEPGRPGVPALVGIEAPQRAAGGGIEREHAEPGRAHVHDAVAHQRIALHLGVLARIAGVELPGQRQARNISRMDLFQR